MDHVHYVCLSICLFGWFAGGHPSAFNVCFYLSLLICLYYCTHLHVHLNVRGNAIFKNTFLAETKSLWSQGPVTWDFWKEYSIGRDIRILHIFACAHPGTKSFLYMLSKQWNMFCICSASNEIRSAYGQHILNDAFEVGCDFPFCWACAKIVYLLSEHEQKFSYSLAEHTRKSFRHTTYIFRVFLSSPVTHSSIPFSRPYLTPFVPSVPNS